MFRRLTGVFLCTLATVSGADAVVITVGNAHVPLDTTIAEVPVMVSGGELVTEMAGVMMVGDGGTVLGNDVAVPQIVSVSFDGSIWDQAAGGWSDNFNTAETGEVVFPDVALDEAGQSVTAEGLLVTLSVDLTDYGPGTWGLAAHVYDVQTTILSFQADPLETITFVDGSITIVPEPLGWTLLMVGLAGCGWGRRRGRSQR